jgi:uncharacterized RDD family membrane protein YckC
MLVIFLPFVLMSLAGGHRGSGPLDALASLGLLSLLVSLILAAVPVGRRRALHDLCAGSRVVRATKRKIEWKQDARLMMPGRVDLTKQA